MARTRSAGRGIGEGVRWRRAWERPPYGTRGQALIVAVLVLFAVATLAALFTAIVSSQVAQTGRHADMVQLRNVAEAGLRWANEQLSYSMDGADWRPSQKTFRTGGGEVAIDISYGPSPTQLQSRFIRIVASAVFPDNPFLRHTILALKPLLLTDYARFITDRYETNEPASLGASGVELGGKPREAGNGAPYVFQVTGPIRSNTDLAFYGNSQISLFTRNYSDMATTWNQLGMLRDDTIEVSGEMYSKDTITDATTGTQTNLSRLSLLIDNLIRTDDVFNVRSANPSNADMADYQNGYPAWRSDGTQIPNTWRVLANLRDYQMPMATGPLRPNYLAPPRIRPPLIDSTHPDLQTNRYLALTRDSGDWMASSGATPGTVYFLNTGRYGWGWTNKNGGIYIDNTADLQYKNLDGTHDLEKLRRNWVGSVGAHQVDTPPGDQRIAPVNRPPAGPADWWDKTGRYYSPPGVEIILHGDAACPWVELIRDDAKQMYPSVPVNWSDPNTYFFWQKSQGGAIPASTTATSNPYRGTGGACQAPLMDPRPQAYGNWAAMPFPPNGVIYAEGNVRIRGIMPPARYEPTTYMDAYDASKGAARRFDLTVASGGTIYIEGDLLTPGPDGARVRRVNKYGNTDQITTLELDRLWGSRIALLARDYVCLNTTALLPRPSDMLPWPSNVPSAAAMGQPRVVTTTAGSTTTTTTYWYNDAQPLYPVNDATYPPSTYQRFPLWQGISKGDIPDQEYNGTQPVATVPEFTTLRYNNIRLQVPDLKGNITDLCLFLGHAGWYAPDYTTPGTGIAQQLVNDKAKVKAALTINGSATPWAWGEGTDRYTFAATAGTDQSAFWYDIVGAANRLEFLPNAPSPGKQTMFMWRQAAGVVTGNDQITVTPQVYPVTQTDPVTGAITWVIRPEWLGYLLGPVAIAPPRWVTTSSGTPDVGNPKIPMTVDVQALIYAQNGSWFILPGPWFSDDPSNIPTATPDPVNYPRYHEPLNIQLQFFGAISENMPAPIGDVADWTSKWSGTKEYAETYGSNALRYYYDPLLRVSRLRRDPLNPNGLPIQTPRFKAFPLTPDLVVWGERISGQAGG